MTQEDKMCTDAPARNPFADAAARKPHTGAPAPQALAEDEQHRSPYAAYLGSPENRIGSTQPIAVRRGLFDGISVAQVIAASAAAATSMLLASRIGIAGSVIGAAVSSMVTVICSQLYRNALDASAEKLKEKQMLAAAAHGGPRQEDARGHAAPQTRGGVVGRTAPRRRAGSSPRESPPRNSKRGPRPSAARASERSPWRPPSSHSPRWRPRQASSCSEPRARALGPRPSRSSSRVPRNPSRPSSRHRSRFPTTADRKTPLARMPAWMAPTRRR